MKLHSAYGYLTESIGVILQQFTGALKHCIKSTV